MALLDTRADGSTTWRSANKLPAAAALAGRAGNPHSRGMAAQGVPHPAQQAMVDHYGSQCGYCTPGFVASMFEGCYREGPDPTSRYRQSALRQSLPLHRLSAHPRGHGERPPARRRAEGDPFRERLKEPAPQLHPVDFEGQAGAFIGPPRSRNCWI